MPFRLVVLRNVLKGWLLLAGVCAIFGAAGWVLGGYQLLSVFVFCALLLALGTYSYADRIALGMLDARELPLAEGPHLHTTVSRLAARAELVPPRVYVIQDGHPRALAVGRGPRGATLVVTAGLLSVTAPAELEGVVAHELAHLRLRDVAVQTTVVILAVALIETSRIGGFLERALLFLLAPVAAALVHLMLSPKRELTADRFAAELCESPHGLADGLLRMDQAGALVEFRASPATEPLYTIDPFADDALSSMFKSHPPLDERVRRLRALDPDWSDRLRAVA